jgi:hypothetical protein
VPKTTPFLDDASLSVTSTYDALSPDVSQPDPSPDDRRFQVTVATLQPGSRVDMTAPKVLDSYCFVQSTCRHVVFRHYLPMDATLPTRAPLLIGRARCVQELHTLRLRYFPSRIRTELVCNEHPTHSDSVLCVVSCQYGC